MPTSSTPVASGCGAFPPGQAEAAGLYAPTAHHGQFGTWPWGCRSTPPRSRAGLIRDPNPRHRPGAACEPTAGNGRLASTAVGGRDVTPAVRRHVDQVSTLLRHLDGAGRTRGACGTCHTRRARRSHPRALRDRGAMAWQDHKGGDQCHQKSRKVAGREEWDRSRGIGATRLPPSASVADHGSLARQRTESGEAVPPRSDPPLRTGDRSALPRRTCSCSLRPSSEGTGGLLAVRSP